MHAFRDAELTSWFFVGFPKPAVPTRATVYEAGEELQLLLAQNSVRKSYISYVALRWHKEKIKLGQFRNGVRSTPLGANPRQTPGFVTVSAGSRASKTAF